MGFSSYRQPQTQTLTETTVVSILTSGSLLDRKVDALAGAMWTRALGG
jgi:hypothetical protein